MIKYGDTLTDSYKQCGEQVFEAIGHYRNCTEAIIRNTSECGEDFINTIDDYAKKAVDNGAYDSKKRIYKEYAEGSYDTPDEFLKELKNAVGEGGIKSIDYIQLSEDLGKKIETDGYKIIDIEDAVTANQDWADMGYNLPPVAEGTKAYNVEAGNFQYARVFKEGVNKPKSPFILRADDIEGLTAEQIAQKYALPQIPDRVVYPHIPSDTPLEISIVGPQESWGTIGGDAQYAIKDALLDDDWFTDIHPLD